MSGVEILNSEAVYNTILPSAFLVIGLILAGVFFVELLSSEKLSAGIVLAVLVLASLAVAALGGIENKNSINHIEYQVTIDESVSMVEFLDKYEIIDQAGKIYTVKEKE